jgi:hypothetical protein
MNWDDLQSYVIFLRYKRSGSALLQNLIDAHPNAIFPRAEEAYANFEKKDKEEILSGIWKHSKKFTHKDFYANGYRYPIEGTGRIEGHSPLVVGHKSSTRRFLEMDTDRFLAWRAKMGVPLSIVHLVRDPYKQIEARWQQKEWRRNNAPLHKLIDELEPVFEANMEVRRACNMGLGWYHQIYLEDLIQDPKKIMKNLVSFLKLPENKEHLERGAELVFEEDEVYANVTWTQLERERIERLIKKYPLFLRRYGSR